MQRSSEAISVRLSHPQRELGDAVLVNAQQTSKAASDQERERIFAKEGLYLSGDLLTLL